MLGKMVVHISWVFVNEVIGRKLVEEYYTMYELSVQLIRDLIHTIQPNNSVKNIF